MASVRARSLEALSDFVGTRMYKTLPTHGKLRMRPGMGRGQALMLKHTVGAGDQSHYSHTQPLPGQLRPPLGGRWASCSCLTCLQGCRSIVKVFRSHQLQHSVEQRVVGQARQEDNALLEVAALELCIADLAEEGVPIVTSRVHLHGEMW